MDLASRLLARDDDGERSAFDDEQEDAAAERDEPDAPRRSS